MYKHAKGCKRYGKPPSAIELKREYSPEALLADLSFESQFLVASVTLKPFLQPLTNRLQHFDPGVALVF